MRRKRLRRLWCLRAARRAAVRRRLVRMRRGRQPLRGRPLCRRHVGAQVLVVQQDLIGRYLDSSGAIGGEQLG